MLVLDRHRHRRLWHATQHCVAPYVDHVLHRDRFWAISIASGSVRLCDLRSCCTVPSRVMRGRPRGLIRSSGGRVDRILLASALSSIHAMCPKRVRRLSTKLTFSPEADSGPAVARFHVPGRPAVVVSLLQSERQNRKHVRLVVSTGRQDELRTRLATTHAFNR